MEYIKRGTPAFKNANLALFAGGFSTFSILWGTQPLLPDIAKEFAISPAASSLSQSSTTIALAISLLIAGSLSDVYGRKSVMTFSLLASSILAVCTGFASSFHMLVVGRILQDGDDRRSVWKKKNPATVANHHVIRGVDDPASESVGKNHRDRRLYVRILRRPLHR